MQTLTAGTLIYLKGDGTVRVIKTWQLTDEERETNQMSANCNEIKGCIHQKPSGDCGILSETVFNRPCPFRKEKGSAAADQSKAKPKDNY